MAARKRAIDNEEKTVDVGDSKRRRITEAAAVAPEKLGQLPSPSAESIRVFYSKDDRADRVALCCGGAMTMEFVGYLVHSRKQN